MKKINYCGHKKNLAQEWNNLNKHDAILTYKLLRRPFAALVGEESVLEASQVTILAALLEITDNDFKEIKEAYANEYDNPDDAHSFYLSDLKEVIKELDFLFDFPRKEAKEKEEPFKHLPIAVVKPALTINHFPQIRLKDKKGITHKLFGPKDELSNISFYELSYIATYYVAYIKQRKSEFLNKLLAVMYRPSKKTTKDNIAKNYNNDIRLPLLEYEATVNQRADLFANLDDDIKHFILFWAGSCYHAITQEFKSIFNKEGETAGGNKYGWSAIIQSVAKEPRHINATVSHNYYTILQHIDLNIQATTKRGV